ncbi:MAG: zinc carboxypeptidase, partial [Saprospiraceae bacterium]|nr:zinc carboxypeptidase [Saprospiraceae bacterium]
MVKKDCARAQIQVFSLQNGYATEGVDLGSSNIKTTRKPEALMVVGAGVSGYEAGEVWHLLDQRVGMPLTKVEHSNLLTINLNRYNTMIMVGGQYRLDSAVTRKIKAWVQAGGTLITQKTASEWAIKNGLVRETLIVDTSKIKRRLSYDETANWQGAKSIGGS